MVRNSDFRRSWANYCSYCGVKLCHDCRRRDGKTPEGKRCMDMATWDHVVPHLRGKGVIGRDKVVACHACNHDRGDKMIKNWRKSLRQRIIAGTIHPDYLEKAMRVIGYEGE